jgi:hypothetical protein
MHKWSDQDKLNRTAKIAVDTGEVKSIEEAEKLFSTYHLAIEVGPDVAASPTLQTILLTSVNAARRCFLGGVQVSGTLDVALKVHWKNLPTLKDAITDLHGQVVNKVSPGIPRIIVGDVPTPEDAGEFAVRATFDGWSGGIIPLYENARLPESIEFTPSGVLAGAIAISEAFQFVRGRNVMAGNRAVGLSLWKPDSQDSWRVNGHSGPAVRHLPSKLWMIGLGHLGQAFLWTLGTLPYAQPSDVMLVLQDYDTLADANDSTSPLTFPPLFGQMKTRAMADWCESRGFSSRICEREFSDNFKIADNEPSVAVCGVDNQNARATLESVGLHRIVEAGLGQGPQEFLAFQIHTFPGPQNAKTKWQSAVQDEIPPSITEMPAYQALGKEGFDQCGLAMLAGRSVGASFVGLFTSALVMAELIKMANGYHQYALIDGTLRSLDHLEAIKNEFLTSAFNPGVTEALGSF